VRFFVLKIAQKILNFFAPKKLRVHKSPIQFSDSAISAIEEHISKRSVASAFKIEVVYRKDVYQCNVGFDDAALIQITEFHYPVKLIISKRDERFLRGSTLEYNETEKNFYIYPDIQIEILTHNKNFLKLFLNRNCISERSQIPFLALESSQIQKDSHPLLKKIFATQTLESIFIKANLISIEKKTTLPMTEFEDLIIDIILDYFSSCGYPLKLTDTLIEVDRGEIIP
jgi:Fe-S cluster assembly iron-binding protein IscA